MTSYQNRVENIKFLKQRGNELEAIIENLISQLRKNKIEPRLPITRIGGDNFITDVNSGEFTLRLLTK